MTTQALMTTEQLLTMGFKRSFTAYYFVGDDSSKAGWYVASSGTSSYFGHENGDEPKATEREALTWGILNQIDEDEDQAADPVIFGVEGEGISVSYQLQAMLAAARR